MARYQRVLAAVDLGANSAAVLRQAVDLALLCNSGLTVLHVVDAVPATDVDQVIPSPDEMQDKLIAAAEQRLQQLLAQPEIKGDVEARVISGRPKVEILRIAADEKADLIVIGTHGRHGLQGLLGSTTDRVLRQAACDVLTVRG